MPENIVPSLFGLQPWQIQQQQNQGLQSAAEAYGNQTPAQRINSGFYQAGGMLGNAAAQGMGMVNPQIQQAQQMNQFMQGVDTSSSASILAGARKALDSGLPQVAAVLNQMARTADAEEAKAQQERATSQLRYAETSTKLAEAGKGTPEMQNAASIADSSGLQRGTPEWKSKYLEIMTSPKPKDEKISLVGTTPQGQQVYFSDTDGQFIAQGNKRVPYTGSLALTVPKEPTATKDIVDPKDPTRMIAINVGLYKGGSIGDVGVIGVSGKEPTAAKKEAEMATGKESADNLIANLRDKYTQLNAAGGIVNPKSEALSNITAATGSSGVGQFFGKITGTQNQTLRNEIAQTRPLLLSAIKQRTGMSAKQMDSNVELKLWLSAATDPTLDYESNMNALDNLEKMIGSGTLKNTPNKEMSALPPPSQLTGKIVRDTVTGNRYKSDGTNWVKQ